MNGRWKKSPTFWGFKLPTLREVLGLVSEKIDVAVTEGLVDNLERRMKNAVKSIEFSYDSFFESMAEVIGEGSEGSGVQNDSGGSPMLRGSMLKTRWKPLNQKWSEKKETKAARVGSGANALRTMYHGLTRFAAVQSGRPRTRKGRFTATRPSAPFADFLQDVGGNDGLAEKLFGPVTVEFTLSRPGSTNIKIKSLDEIEDKVRQFRARAVKKGFHLAAPGVKITAKITAFSKVQTNWSEDDIVRYVISKDRKNLKQWGKINGNWKRRGVIRPIFQPLMEYMVSTQFPNDVRLEFS